MSKKLKFLVIIISLAIIIGLIFGIMAIYRFCVIQSIFKRIDENIEIGNYSLKTTLTNKDGEKTVTQAYYKDGIGKNIASNGIYTWVDERDAYMVDEENNTIYVLDIEGENSISLVSDKMFASLVPGYNKSFFERILMACNLKVKIKPVKLNDQKCYMIEDNEQKAKKTVWVTKDRKNPIKAKIEFENGEAFEYDYELKFLATKLRDVELPDTKNYTLINYETGEVILDEKENVNAETNNITENTIVQNQIENITSQN